MDIEFLGEVAALTRAVVLKAIRQSAFDRLATRATIGMPWHLALRPVAVPDRQSEP